MLICPGVSSTSINREDIPSSYHSWPIFWNPIFLRASQQGLFLSFYLTSIHILSIPSTPPFPVKKTFLIPCISSILYNSFNYYIGGEVTPLEVRSQYHRHCPQAGLHNLEIVIGPCGPGNHQKSQEILGLEQSPEVESPGDSLQGNFILDCGSWTTLLGE